MFGIGFGEFVILAIIIFVLIGPKQLPEVMKTIGKIVREITKARDDLRTTIDQDDSLRSIKESVQDVRRTVDFKVGDLKSALHSKLIAEQEKADKAEAAATEKPVETSKTETKPHE